FAPASVIEDRTPAVISSSRSSTEGYVGSTYILDPETPSSKNAFRARAKASSLRVRAETARAEAIPKCALYFRPSWSVNMSPGDSSTPPDHDPVSTWHASAADARATSRA